MEIKSVESLCNLIGKVKLLKPEQLRTLLPLWRQQPQHDGEGAPQRFAKWLVQRGDLTSYQADRLCRGQADHYYLGEYKLLDRLGQGAMAGVYKGEHPSGQIVAIKVLPPSKVKEPQSFGRFQREARLALQFNHPNIVRTFQVGEDQGLHFIVMEVLQGEALDDVLQRRRKLPVAEGIRIIHQALLGLQHVHEQGIIHRDLKPGNLMLLGGTAESTASATVKIVDVGMGKALFDESPDNVNLTGAGAILGTPNYMAPEQARSAAKADIRADIYSLGCVLYSVLAGQVPFPESNLMKKLMKHATEMAPPVRTFTPEVPQGVHEIIERMMAKDPSHRFQTPGEAAQALAAFLQPAMEASPVETDGTLRDYEQWLTKQTPGIEIEAPAASMAVASPVVAAMEPIIAIVASPVASERRAASWMPTGRDWLFFALGSFATLLLAVLLYLIMRSGS